MGQADERQIRSGHLSIRRLPPPSRRIIIRQMMVPTAPVLYEKPPLIEALIGVAFLRPAEDWDSIFFGKIHAELQDRFPIVETIRGASIDLSRQGLALQAAPEVKRFKSLDGGIVVTVGPENVGVSYLPPLLQGPYPGWARLLDTTVSVLQAYNSVVPVVAARQIGVRYINVLPFDPKSFQLDSVLSQLPKLIPPAVFKERHPFNVRLERVISSSSATLHRETITLAAQAIQQGGGQLVLDVDESAYPGTNPSAAKFEIRDVSEMLHEQIRRRFDELVLKTVRDSFGRYSAPSIS